MVYEAAHQQHLEWLQAQLAQQESELAEAQATVAQLQESVAYFKDAIAVVMSSEPNPTLVEKLSEQDSFTTNGRKGVVGLFTENKNLNGGDTASRIILDNEDSDSRIILDNEDSALEDDWECKETEEANKRSPKDMLLPEFRDETLGDIAEKKLKASAGKALSSDELTKMMFDTRSEDEYVRARNSLSAELRRGANEGRWKKAGRGIFVIEVQVETNISRTEAQQRLYTVNSAQTLDS